MICYSYVPYTIIHQIMDDNISILRLALFDLGKCLFDCVIYVAIYEDTSLFRIFFLIKGRHTNLQEKKQQVL